MKVKEKKFQILVRRSDYFNAIVNADSFAEASEIVKNMSLKDLLDADGETIHSEHEIIWVMKS